jgi:hypothetical protein
MKLEYFRRSFAKYSNIKFHENPSSGSQGVPCGREDGDMADMKLIVFLRNFANAPENHFFFIV